MTKLFTVLIIIISSLSLVGCSRISIDYDGNATLRFRGTRIDDNTKLTQMLTEEETNTVRTYLSSAEYVHGQVGCPFDENISITFVDEVFAIACDGRPSVWSLDSDKY